MKRIGYYLLLIFLLFSNVLFTWFKLPPFVGYYDEILAILLFIWMMYKINIRKRILKSTSYILCCVFIVIVIGISGNILFRYQSSVSAILRDIVIFCKFPISFIAMQELHLDDKMYRTLSGKGVKTLKIITHVILLLGIVSIFFNIGMVQDEIRHGIHPYMFLFSHPTSLVTCGMFLIAIFSAFEYTGKMTIYIYEVAAIIVLTMRTKGVALVAVFLFLKFFRNKGKKLKILYWMGAIGVVALSLYQKLQMVFSWSGSGRMSLYTESFGMMERFFPIGSGFATYASSLSGKFASSLYNEIYIPELQLLQGNYLVLGDVGFPYYIGQFGFAGVILSFLILIKIFKITYQDPTDLGCLAIFAYILLAMIGENILSNSGVECAVFLALVSHASKVTVKHIEYKNSVKIIAN